MRLRKPVFIEDPSNATTEELVKDMNSKYAVKHTDGWECGLQWRVSSRYSAKIKLFDSYADAIDYCEQGSVIYQTY